MVRVGIWAVGRLSQDDREGMEQLYREYYEGANEGDFARDLAEKDWAIVLRDAEGVRGFSTMKLVRVEETNVLFSGDTVVDEACRSQTGLAGAFGHVMRHLAETGVEDPHWFLICKGARTYRFLPTFFRRYVPGPREDAELAERLRGKDRLKGDALRMDRESVRFRALNPDWARGDELCCMAPLALSNLNRLGERVIADTNPEWHL